VHRLGMTPSILAELDLGGGAEAERLILVRNGREPRHGRIIRRWGLSVAAVQEAKPPASLMMTQSAEDETSPHTRCCGSVGLVTNNRCALQTWLTLHKRLQHFTATKFLVHTRVTLAN